MTTVYDAMVSICAQGFGGAPNRESHCILHEFQYNRFFVTMARTAESISR